MPAESYVYKLQKGTKFLSLSDEFTEAIGMRESSKSFESQEAALTKAEELGLDLDQIRVIRFKARPTTD